jgi:hypothetical protein
MSGTGKGTVMPVHAMKTHSGADVELHSFLTLASEVVSFTPQPLYRRGKVRGTRGIEGRMGGEAAI